MLKISENNGAEEICLVTPTPGDGLFVTLSAARSVASNFSEID